MKQNRKLLSDSSNNEEGQPSNTPNSDLIVGDDDDVNRNIRAYSISPFRPKKMFVMDQNEEEKLSEHDKEEKSLKHLIMVTEKS